MCSSAGQRPDSTERGSVCVCVCVRVWEGVGGWGMCVVVNMT